MSAHDISPRNFLRAATATFAVLILFCLPSPAHAATYVRVNSAIPPNADPHSCAPIQVSDIQPYIYGGKLHSFEFTISNPSYVALGGTVGDEVIGFQYMTRWLDSGGLRIHIDVQSKSLANDLPIQIILLSAAGSVTCTAAVSSVVPAVPQPVPQTSYPPTTIPSEKPVGTPSTEPMPSEQGEGQAQAAATSAPMFVGALHSLGNLCQVGGASRLWIVLVVLYALFVITLILQKPDTFGDRTLEWNIALILILFLGLVAFWYLSLSCRTGPWAPAATTGIAIIGLVALLIFGRPTARPIFLLEEKKVEKKVTEEKVEKAQ